MRHLFSRLDTNTKQALNLGSLSGFFWFAWAFGCYQTVYLQSIGFSASQLGLLNSISSGVGIASVAFWGMVSDRMGSLRKVLVIVLAAGAGLYALTPLIPPSPIFLMIFLPAVHFFRGSQSTFSENLLVRNCNELRLNYGVLRSAGSFLFTVGSLLIASFLPTVGVQNTFWLSGILMIVPVALTLCSREPAARPAAKKGEKAEKLDLAPLFQNKVYLMFLVFTFVFYLASSCESTFLPYFMSSAHIPAERYGVALAYRALLEIPFLLVMVRLRRRFSLRALVAAAPLLMALECLGFGLFAKSLPGMLLFCTFFGLGNGLFIGSSLNYVYELAPAHLKASAQAFYAAVSSVAGILGNLLGGIVFDGIGAKPFYLVIAAMYVFSAAIFVLSFLRRGKTSAVSDK